MSPVVTIGIDDLGHGEQSAVLHRHIVEQAKVCGEDLAHVHNEQDADHGAQVGQGHIADLIPFACAVNGCGLILGGVNTGDGS